MGIKIKSVEPMSSESALSSNGKELAVKSIQDNFALITRMTSEKNTCLSRLIQACLDGVNDPKVLESLRSEYDCAKDLLMQHCSYLDASCFKLYSDAMSRANEYQQHAQEQPAEQTEPSNPAYASDKKLKLTITRSKETI